MLNSRRSFLKTAAAATTGIVFCGCGLVGNAHAQRADTHRLPVTVNGKRVKTIDVHAHCLFREAAALLGDEARDLTPPIRDSQKAYLDVEERINSMANQAVDLEVLSINPYWYAKDRDLAAKIVAIQNEKLADLVATHPDHFAAFASLTLQDPQLAVQELETAMTRQGLRGAAIGAVVAGSEFSHPKFNPVWAKAEELGAVLFIHPQEVPELTPRLKGNGWLANLVGYPLETTIALQHLIFDGTLDRYPGLKVLAAHGGGYLASYAARSDHACFVGDAFCNKDVKLKKQPSEYLNQLYYDSLVFTPEALRHLVAQVGASQIMLGTDNPYLWEGAPVDHIFATTTLSDAEKAAILGGNAADLFGLKV